MVGITSEPRELRQILDRRSSCLLSTSFSTTTPYITYKLIQQNVQTCQGLYLVTKYNTIEPLTAIMSAIYAAYSAISSHQYLILITYLCY